MGEGKRGGGGEGRFRGKTGAMQKRKAGSSVSCGEREGKSGERESEKSSDSDDN